MLGIEIAAAALALLWNAVTALADADQLANVYRSPRASWAAAVRTVTAFWGQERAAAAILTPSIPGGRVSIET